jgi:uncharacterized repeat protein (TIGR01451 family)
MKIQKHFKASLVLFVVVFIFLLVGISSGVEEPNDLNGVCYSTMGMAETTDPCPAWFTALDRDGTDTGHLTVKLDGCLVIEYEVYTMQQGAAPGELADLEQDDVFVVWDEDAGHGSNTHFTFTGDYIVADPNTDCNYVQVTGTGITNWVLYKVTESGTLTITSTGVNEHDAFRLKYLKGFEKYDDVDDANDLDCRSPGQELTYSICWDNENGHLIENAYITDWLPTGVYYPGSDWRLDPNMTPIAPDPAYDPNTHSYHWDVGSIDPNMLGCVELTVVVTENAEPGRYLHNVAEMYFGDNFIVKDAEDTLVCCWGDGE